MLKSNLQVTIPDSLPKAIGYRMVVIVPELQVKTAGGILLPDKTKDAESYANVVGYVAAQGPDCYSDENRFPTGNWCNTGDWILIGKYDGQRVKCEGSEVRIINDDSVLAVLPDPSTIARAA
jgi:co-chaperonin GroES (HSP10)